MLAGDWDGGRRERRAIGRQLVERLATVVTRNVRSSGVQPGEAGSLWYELIRISPHNTSSARNQSSRGPCDAVARHQSAG